VRKEDFTQVAVPHAAAAEARAAGKLVVWIPGTVRSKEKLFGLLSQALRFPNYFGSNWDALEECLRDLSWLPEYASIMLVHEGLPFGAGENRQIYLEILQSASQRTDGRSLQIILPQ
jgi:RNAse (barnase) inhibitor barstar